MEGIAKATEGMCRYAISTAVVSIIIEINLLNVECGPLIRSSVIRPILLTNVASVIELMTI